MRAPAPHLLAAALLAVLLLGASLPAESRVIHRERSLYSTILVDQRGSTLCLQFSVRKNQRNQSCMDKNNPKRMVFPYARMMMLSLLLVPEPQKILMVGLGGGTIALALNEIYPEAAIEVVEIDPAVKTVAETYFGFAENERLKVILQDARVFGKRALARGERYDLILLDAFNGDYIPEHLLTREYLEEVRDLLTPNGVVAANTFAISGLYDHESNTYQVVFGPFYNIRSGTSANRVILATRGELPEIALLQERASGLAPVLAPFHVRLDEYLGSFTTQPDWDRSARILTDQYAPANLLGDQ